MDYLDLLTKEHGNRLPYVRIKRIELSNFKSVSHGVLTLFGDEIIPYDTKSSILGIYGQNGSGKTAAVDAINLIKGLLCGGRFMPNATHLIDINTGSSALSVEFEFQYKNGVNASVEYSVKLSRKERKLSKSDAVQEAEEEKEYISITEEVIKTDMYADGTQRRRHPIIDTKNYLLCSDACAKNYFGKRYEAVKDELNYLKRKASDDSHSFIFSADMAELIHTDGINSRYTEILTELYLFANQYLYVIGTRSNAIAQLRRRIPMYIPGFNFPFYFNEKEPTEVDLAIIVEREFEKVNMVISTIVPELHLGLEKSPTRTKDGEEAYFLKLLSIRGDKKIPFEYESDGIIKIVSILACYIFAFNQGSATLVVDEFDAGVFEYLLGELLQIFESDGKGQLIFTSHNLRPLEVLDKSDICFTTYDPNDRYCHLKNISNTNNLRDQYLKAVQMGNTDLELYKKTKAFKIVKALKMAGKEPENDG